MHGSVTVAFFLILLCIYISYVRMHTHMQQHIKQTRLSWLLLLCYHDISTHYLSIVVNIVFTLLPGTSDFCLSGCHQGHHHVSTPSCVNHLINLGKEIGTLKMVMTIQSQHNGYCIAR